jgi:DNA-damage-inducible protein D
MINPPLERWIQEYIPSIMSNLAQFDYSQSPFDSIRHFDEQGNEYWLARELMVVLGYEKWQNFHKNIKRALTACQNSQNDATTHFLLTSVKTNGRTADNWKLSRYACYLVAMNGDPDKQEIAQAQSYFAVKTREAEVIIPKQSDELALLKLKLELLKTEKDLMQLKSDYTDKREAIATLQGIQFLALLDGRPDAVVENKEKLTETVICRNGRNISFVGKSTAEMGKELGFKTGKEFELWLARNKAEHLICQGMRAVPAPYIPEENLKEVKQLFAKSRLNSTRQLVLGE